MIEMLLTLLLSIAGIALIVGVIGFPIIMALLAAYNGRAEEARCWALAAICLYFVAPLVANFKGTSGPAEKKASTPEEEKAKREQREAAQHKAEMEERNKRWHRIVQNEQSYNARCPRCKSKDVSYIKQKATTDYSWQPGVNLDGDWSYVSVPTPGKPKIYMKCNSCGKKFTI